MLPLKQFQCSFDWRYSSLVWSKKIAQCYPLPRLSPPGDRWRDALGFMTTGSFSSSSTLQIFRDARPLWGFPSYRPPPPPCPASLSSGSFPVTTVCLAQYIHRSFRRCISSIWHIPVWASHSSFHLFVASSVNLWGWWHVWSDWHLWR